MKYPKYFLNKNTQGVYMFCDIDRGSMYQVYAGVTEYPYDTTIRKLRPHTNTNSWREVHLAEDGSVITEMSEEEEEENVNELKSKLFKKMFGKNKEFYIENIGLRNIKYSDHMGDKIQMTGVAYIEVEFSEVLDTEPSMGGGV